MLVLNHNKKYLVRLSVVPEVRAGDDPAVRGGLANPERLIQALSLGALQDFQASGADDLVNKPQAAPLTVLQNRADQGACEFLLQRSIFTTLFTFISQRFHCNKPACIAKRGFLSFFSVFCVESEKVLYLQRVKRDLRSENLN